MLDWTDFTVWLRFGLIGNAIFASRLPSSCTRFT